MVVQGRPPSPLPYAALSATLPVAVFFVYPFVARVLGLPAPVYHVEMLFIVPVFVDEGSMLLASALVSAAALPLYLYARRVYAYRSRLREQMREFLLIYSGIVESVESVAEGLLTAARLVGQPLASIVESMARVYIVTGDLEYAYRRAFSRAPREARLLAASIVAAARSGGRVSEILSMTARYASELKRLELAVNTRLAEYTMIVVMASITYAFTAMIILGLVEVMTGSAAASLLATVPPVELLRGVFYYSMMTITVFSSLVVGRVIRGYALLSTKYILLLVPVNTLILLYGPRFMPF